MRASLRLVLLASLLLAACGSAATEAPTETSAPQATEVPADTATPEPTPTETIPEINFSFYSSEPVIANGTGDHWTGKWMNPGGVVYADGLFHMYLNAFHEWQGEISIGHFTSEDGYTWTLAQEDPIFTSEAVPYLPSGRGIDISTALVTEDGTWVLYYHSIVGGPGEGIGRATAPGPDGPWTFDEGPVLEPSERGAWDDNMVSWPNVLQTEDGYVMFYTGADVRGNMAIGRATSSDGISWTKYDDPATTEEPYAVTDPVLVASDAAWDKNGTDRPRAQLTPDGWVMIYSGETLNNRGLAFSEDGIHWEPFAGNPILTLDDFSSMAPNFWDNNLFYKDGTYYWYMELGSLANTQIFLSTFEGSLLP